LKCVSKIMRAGAPLLGGPTPGLAWATMNPPSSAYGAKSAAKAARNQSRAPGEKGSRALGIFRSLARIVGVMSDFDQRTLAELWELENGQMQDQRVELSGDRFLSLFLDKLDGKSHVFEHGLDAATDAAEVGDAEYWVYDTAEQATLTFRQLVGEARAEGRLVEEDSLEELGDAELDGPETTEVGEENIENDLGEPDRRAASGEA